MASLGRLPGPFHGPLSSLYRVWLLSDGKGPISYVELHERYSTVVQTGPKHVSISDSAMIRTVYDVKNDYIKESLPFAQLGAHDSARLT